MSGKGTTLESPKQAEAEAPAKTQNGGTAPSASEQEMVIHLRNIINHDGSYTARLNDIATGYAAAKGISFPMARGEIEKQFETQMGMTPHEYLEQHFSERRSLRDNSKSQGRSS